MLKRFFDIETSSDSLLSFLFFLRRLFPFVLFFFSLATGFFFPCCIFSSFSCRRLGVPSFSELGIFPNRPRGWVAVLRLSPVDDRSSFSPTAAGSVDSCGASAVFPESGHYFFEPWAALTAGPDEPAVHGRFFPLAQFPPRRLGWFPSDVSGKQKSVNNFPLHPLFGLSGPALNSGRWPRSHRLSFRNSPFVRAWRQSPPAS